MLTAALLGWMFDGFEMGIFPLIARPALQQMRPPGAALSDAFVGHWMGVVTALFLFGAAVGGGVFGWLGDRLGRVRAMTISVLCYSVFTGAIFFCRTPLQLGVLRFLAALGMGGEWSLGVALVMEFWPAHRRALLAGLIGAANNVGFALVGLAGLAFPVTVSSWRWMAVIGVLPAFLAVIIQRFVPESPAWRHEAARAELRPIREILGSSAWKLILLASTLSGVALIGSWGSVQWLPLWADQMAGAGAPQAKAYVQLMTAIGAILGGLAGAAIAQRLGRRTAYFMMSLLSFLSCAAMFHWVRSYGATFLLGSFVLGAATTTFYGWLPLYLPEIFPTRIRATAQGIAFNLGRALAALGVLETGALMQTFGGSYQRAGATISLVYAAGMALIWLAPESVPPAAPQLSSASI